MSDTIEYGPSKLLIRQQVIKDYQIHRQKVKEIDPLNQYAEGEHIVKRSDAGPIFDQKEKEKHITKDNLELFDKITNIMTRQTYERHKGGVMIFGRPSWQGKVVNQEDIYNSRLNYKVTKSQHRIRFN